jgi:phage baseplate assembly protein W
MIQLDNIRTPAVRRKEHIYRDLHLDLALDDSSIGLSPISTQSPALISYKDIKQAVDESAIKNSLINLFNTFPGQKLLNPEYGLDLAQYLFTPVSDSVAQQIGDDILSGITKYEPRVTVENVSVGADPENSQYEITLTIIIPKISDSTVSFSGILDPTGLKF